LTLTSRTARASPIARLQLTTIYLVLQYTFKMKQSRPAEQESADKWEVQLRKGCLELAILAALWEGKLYGLEILRRLESDSDLVVSEGTVYPLLSRLKVLGLVRSEWVESDSGHPRKYYTLTLAGKQRSREMAAMWMRFSSSMNRLLAPLAQR
jgi:PadR family transcriptional regulator PadR